MSLAADLDRFAGAHLIREQRVRSLDQELRADRLEAIPAAGRCQSEIGRRFELAAHRAELLDALTCRPGPLCQLRAHLQRVPERAS